MSSTLNFRIRDDAIIEDGFFHNIAIELLGAEISHDLSCFSSSYPRSLLRLVGSSGAQSIEEWGTDLGGVAVVEQASHGYT